jgi:hypothetical protein
MTRLQISEEWGILPPRNALSLIPNRELDEHAPSGTSSFPYLVKNKSTLTRLPWCMRASVPLNPSSQLVNVWTILYTNWYTIMEPGPSSKICFIYFYQYAHLYVYGFRQRLGEIFTVAKITHNNTRIAWRVVFYVSVSYKRTVDSKVWLRVPRDSDYWVIALQTANPSSRLEKAPHRSKTATSDRNLQSGSNIRSQVPEWARHQDIMTDWPSAVK